MKKLFIAIFIISISLSLFAQVSINTDGADPDASAILDVKSTEKGFLPPRMTGAQRDEITNPSAGLLLWCTNCGLNGEMQTFNGTEWVNMLGGAASEVFACGTSTISDIDGNVYQTVLIGTQCWMKENLITTNLNNSNSIPMVTDNTAWAALTTPAYCWHDNYPASGIIYGALYNWYAVNSGNLCPIGWHVPTDGEWTELTNYLGGLTGAGGKLKETGFTHWISPNEGATNESGFTAFPGDQRFNNGTFSILGYYGYWWSSTVEIASNNIWIRVINYNSANVFRYSDYKESGRSVRCIKN